MWNNNNPHNPNNPPSANGSPTQNNVNVNATLNNANAAAADEQIQAALYAATAGYNTFNNNDYNNLPGVENNNLYNAVAALSDDYARQLAARKAAAAPSVFLPPQQGGVFSRNSSAEVEYAFALQQQQAQVQQQVQGSPTLYEPAFSPPAPPRGKPEALAAQYAAARVQQASLEQQPETPALEEAVPDQKPPAKKKASPKKPRPKKRKAEPPPPKLEYTLQDSPPKMTDQDYDQLRKLLQQFCRVPLLTEFAQPVTLTHPDLASAYVKIVSHPVDLGHVCRGVQHRRYLHLRDVKLDVWRVLTNCIKFHSHPTNKHPLPSFVSIAIHLRDYFNALWQEHMLASEVDSSKDMVQAQVSKRLKDRQTRLDGIAMLAPSTAFLRRLVSSLDVLRLNGCCVDKLDATSLWDDSPPARAAQERLRELQSKLQNQLAGDNIIVNMGELTTMIKDVSNEEAFAEHRSFAVRLSHRIGRWYGKLILMIHEANSRGVTQSSIWGNLATVVWARESSKKPYWPALVLGLVAPEGMREPWHEILTLRNEARLPAKLREQLVTAKKKCVTNAKKNSTSFFLVEFFGTHEFIWVRESDIIDSFDPEQDPNKDESNVKKLKRSSRGGIQSVLGSPTYQSALDEINMASEEFENVLDSVFEYDDTKIADPTTTFEKLAEDNEDAENEMEHGYTYVEGDMADSDIEEAAYLLAHDGSLVDDDTGAKKKKPAVRKKAGGKETGTIQKKSKAQERADKQEQKEVEKRRKKRSREREKALKEAARKVQRLTDGDDDEDQSGLISDKRTRAEAIAKAYVARVSHKDEHRGLGTQSIMSTPSTAFDSIGLVAMCLAFRALSGELTMPDEPEAHEALVKPWTAVDTQGPKTSAERVINLEKKAELLRAEIERVNRNMLRRRELLARELDRRKKIDEDVAANDVSARVSYYKPRKKVPPKGSTASPAPPAAVVMEMGKDAPLMPKAVALASEPAAAERPMAMEIDSPSTTTN